MENNAKLLAPPRLNADARVQLSTAWKLYCEEDHYGAGQLCHLLLERNPAHAEALHLLALVRWRQGDRNQAIRDLKKAIAHQPDQPLHYNNLGVFLNEEGLYEQAAVYLGKALKRSPHYADARCNLGLALFHQNRLKQAVRCFNNAIAESPSHSPAYANLGMALLALGTINQAAEAYERALAIDPHQAHWWGNLGAAYLSMDKLSQSVHAFQQAHYLDPNNAAHCIHLSVAQRANGDIVGSINLLQKALVQFPDHPEVLSNLCIAYQQTCQWEQLGLLKARLDKNTNHALENNTCPAEQPMYNIWRSTDPGLNLKVARAWSREANNMALRSSAPCSHRPPIMTARKITLGYLSYDFRNHPVAHQLLPLFGLHDRSRYRVVAFSMGPDDASSYRAQIQNDCDEFIEIGHLDPERAARLINEHGIDILIDLMGHSHHNRLQILALRPAPIQVSYLGFLASTGADFIDYLVTDVVVVPSAHNNQYTEKLIRLPHCYQMNHTLFFPSTTKKSREYWGLPSQGFVFCCFNNAYKINANLFSAWITILKQVPDSVLWLFRDNATAQTQLEKHARQMGLDHRRLIFADKAALPDHILRLQLADLALDTDGYNGGATTANALWASVPVLTILGSNWVSRMSASHLIAAGIPELVTANLDEYTRSAINLARDPEQLQAMRKHLNHRRRTSPLFDAAAFTRDLETGFERIWAQYCNGLAPAHVSISPQSVHSRIKTTNAAT